MKVSIYFVTSWYFGVLLILSLLFINPLTDLAKIWIELLGGLGATFVGVYLSLILSEKQLRKTAAESEKKTYLGALRLVRFELYFNEKIIVQLIKGFEEMRRQNGSDIHGNVSFLLKHANAVKSNSFYSVIASGALDEISKNDLILNELVNTYYNLDLSLNNMVVTIEAMRNASENTHDLSKALTENWNRVLERVKKCEQVLQEELEKNHIIVTSRN